MNEKIKEFAKQAWPGLPSHWWDSRDGAEAVEKFAEMVVRECAEFANEHNSEVEGVTLGVGRALKKHFGVEE
jgi:hypothetical protein